MPFLPCDCFDGHTFDTKNCQVVTAHSIKLDVSISSVKECLSGAIKLSGF